jgi:hypothetical protein
MLGFGSAASLVEVIKSNQLGSAERSRVRCPPHFGPSSPIAHFARSGNSANDSIADIAPSADKGGGNYPATFSSQTINLP